MLYDIRLHRVGTAMEYQSGGTCEMKYLEASLGCLKHALQCGFGLLIMISVFANV